jgi:Fe-S cluster assembly ATP-binding protein
MIWFKSKKKRREDKLVKKFAELTSESKISARIKETLDYYIFKNSKDPEKSPAITSTDILSKVNKEIIDVITSMIVKEIEDKIQQEIQEIIEKIKDDIKNHIIEERRIMHEKLAQEELEKEIKDKDLPNPPDDFYDGPGFFIPNYINNSDDIKPELFPAAIFNNDLPKNLHPMKNSLSNIHEKQVSLNNNINKIPLFEIKNLTASINDIIILKDFNLKIYHGEVHVIMGRNGSGKSTLSKIIAGHPAYKVMNGDMLFEGKSILNLEPEERSHLGLFLAFQYPIEIPGVSNEDFLRLAYNAKLKTKNLAEVNPIKFLEIINDKLKIVQMDSAFLARNINEGFSGGEKKRNEILQMALLDPQLSILDETDSGLDIDALKIVAKGINHLMNKNKAMILITHYQRLLDYVKPDYIHIIQNGTIIKTGNADLAIELEINGYGIKDY